MLSVIMHNFIVLNVVILSVIMLRDVMLSVIMFSDTKTFSRKVNVILLSGIMLNVTAPKK